jgi:hypothetical protein
MVDDGVQWELFGLVWVWFGFGISGFVCLVEEHV